jgi:ABC-2 type transport system permease protein
VIRLKGVFSTLRMSAMNRLHGGVPSLLAGYLLKIIYLLPMVFLWRTIAESGADLGGFTLPRLLTYACMSSVLGTQLNVVSVDSAWDWDVPLIDHYRRPATVFGQIISRTVGSWLPELFMFSLPLLVMLPLFGVSTRPANAWFYPCFALTVSLGFAVDFLFVCLVIRMRNNSWAIHSLRSAVTLLFSGSVIPLTLLPFGLGETFKYLPFGSLAAAPLSVFVGSAGPFDIIPLQIIWNAALWPLAAFAFNATKERMVSYGG